jgi:hypothetical protein
MAGLVFAIGVAGIQKVAVMTWIQIKIWILKYRVFVSVCAALLALLIWDIATTENKLYIQTELAEDDFLVVCGWYSDFLNLHGGARPVDFKVLVGKSNTEMDCGWSLYGDLSVEVMHPLYRKLRGCDHPQLCTVPGFRHEDGSMIFTPVTFDRYLNSLQVTMEGKHLHDRVKAAMGGKFDLYYFRNFLEAREPDLKQFKKLYHSQLIKYWDTSNSIIDSEEDQINPEEAMERYWAKVDKFVKGTL